MNPESKLEMKSWFIIIGIIVLFVSAKALLIFVLDFDISSMIIGALVVLGFSPIVKKWLKNKGSQKNQSVKGEQ